MANITGSITLNGITDSEMARIWEFKAQHGNGFNFSPNQIQQTNAPVQQGRAYEMVYNNVLFSWGNEIGLEIVHEIISYLLKKEVKAEAVAQ